MKSKKRILIAPLDWGIGHATRCIPIINALLSNHFEVIIAADKRPLHLLKKEFPKLEAIRFPGYNIHYPKLLPMSLSMLLQIPKILLGISKERKIIKQVIADYNIDGVISDSRFGLSVKTLPCVFITHQLQIQSPYFKGFIQRLNYKYINHYNACWIIDNEEDNLAGKLSKPSILPERPIYIGPQSRFKKLDLKKKYTFLAIISGPESQRKTLEDDLIKELSKRKEKSMIVLGKPEKNQSNQIGNLTIKSHLNAKELNIIILQSKFILCRPGYSTIMDLAKLGKKAIFIPTPGQTEQEYLANYYLKRAVCFSQKQSEFNLLKALKKTSQFSGFDQTNFSSEWSLLLNIFSLKKVF